MKSLTSKIEESIQFVNHVKEPRNFICDCLTELGIDDDPISNGLLLSDDSKEGDFRQVFCDKHKLPVPRFRRIWRILKELEDAPKETKKEEGFTKELIEQITPIDQWTDRHLLEKYGPECSQAIETELKCRTSLRPCIVFMKNKEVDLEMSLKLIKEARVRETSKVFKYLGKSYRVYRIGEFPVGVYTRCPVTGEILFNGYSESLGVQWELPKEAMQFIALMVKDDIEVTPIVARDLHKEFKENGLEGFRNLFPNTSALYDDLKEVNDLPNLLSTMTSRDAVQDPLGKKHKRF